MSILPDTPIEPNAGRPPDVSEIDVHALPERQLVKPIGPRERRFQVVFKQSVQDQIHLHGQGSAGIEVCGVLVGQCWRDDFGPYLLVEHAIAGNGAASRSTNVTFTAETWSHIHEVMDRDFPDARILGWYHTHPGFGIFLSDMDIFICDHFFNLPWQIAFVYDPVSGEEGNFVWRAGRPQPEPVLVEDDVTPTAAAVPLISKSLMPTSDLPPVENESVDEELIELKVRLRRLERRLKFTMIALVTLAAFVAMWAYEFLPLQPVYIVQPRPTASEKPTISAKPPGPARRSPVGSAPHGR